MKFTDCINKFAHLVPGALEVELVDALRFAVIEFCTKSFILTDWHTKTAADMTFDAAATGIMPVALFDAFVGERRADIYQVNAGQLDSATEDSPVVTYKVDQLHSSIAITPAPSGSASVRLLVAMSPTPDANEYPDHLWMMHREALKAGALARLLSEPGTPYVNEARAQAYRQIFESEIDSAKTAASVNRSTSTQRLRVTPR